MSQSSFGMFTDSPLDAGSAPRGWWRQLWSRREGRLDDIRRRMLAQLDAVPDAAQHAPLAGRIQSARHAEDLWALRQDWMQALADVQGLLLARQRLSEVSFMFAGLLDREQHARDCLEILQQAAGPARGLVRDAQQARSDH
ncbi:hypothetical protein [Pseudorhodoferax sp.]|uniref:hypothetical protein n=1 Tax=Pseudorhodoferax sp. TaxID=1993553 RepID=UPI0039E67629